jgi:hypothetical protein
MSAPHSSPLPKLDVSDFGPGLDHLAEAHQSDRIFAIVHKDDPVRPLLANLYLDPADPWAYVFVHGGQEVTRFEDQQVGLFEIPDHVVARLLMGHYGPRLTGMRIRMCTCYGNLLRPGDTRTLIQGLAGLLPHTVFEGYHGLVQVDPSVLPPRIVLGYTVQWDPVSGPYIVGPPGPWERVTP